MQVWKFCRPFFGNKRSREKLAMRPSLEGFFIIFWKQEVKKKACDASKFRSFLDHFIEARVQEKSLRCIQVWKFLDHFIEARGQEER
jgi:hypothetical protein